MESTRKIWVVVYRRHADSRELLLLRPNPEPGLTYDYYVITGGIDNDESPEEAALRETYEEIGLQPSRLIDLGETMSYVNERNGSTVTEACFLAEVSDANLVLNEEHIDYKWVNPVEFERIIWWEGSRDILNRIMKKFNELS